MANTLWTGDNLYILNGLNSNSVDLIYLDPPFNSKRTYSAPVGSKSAGVSFKDMWTWQDVDEAFLESLFTTYLPLAKFIESIGDVHERAMMAYITYMAQRIVELHRILKKTGSFYLHCDSTASHYLKVILDSIFGHKNFRREIIWNLQTASGYKSQIKGYVRGHDVIFYYTKGSEFVFNKEYLPHKPEYIARFRKSDSDGRKYRDDRRGGRKQYLDETKGIMLTDVWSDVMSFQQAATSDEILGYPTQKPLALLNRIITASSNEGDIVLDPFCGCATTCVSAQQLKRKWIGIDIEEKASEILIQRLSDDAGLFKDFVHRKDTPQRTDIKKEDPKSVGVKKRLYMKQNQKCNGCGTEFEIRHFEVDHITPKSKGGGDYYENFQLLCGSCNRIKGNRPMEYLISRLRVIREASKQLTFGETK